MQPKQVLLNMSDRRERFKLTSLTAESMTMFSDAACPPLISRDASASVARFMVLFARAPGSQ